MVRNTMSLVTGEFIGRNQEVQFLSNWLADSNTPAIVYIHDALEEFEKKGGIGKTWLLNRYYEMVEQQHVPVMIDFFDVMNRDGVVIAQRVVRALEKRYPHWQAQEFEKSLLEYREAVRRQRIEGISFRERLADALVSDLRLLQQSMKESNTYLLLFFDTFELIENNPITAVLRPTQTFPDIYKSSRVRVIIAGRNVLNWRHQNWVGREQEILTYPIAPFTYEETIGYLQNKSEVYDDIASLPQQTLQALYERTEGRPILVGLSSDVLNNRILTPDALATIDRKLFEASLVEEINRFEDPGKWVIFAMAHIYHRFNAAFLGRLMHWPGLQGLVPEIHYQELAERLVTLSFVRRSGSGEDFVLHDEMRRLVNQYCWRIQDGSGRLRRELS